MKFSKETEKRLIAALLPKLANGRIGLCPVCEHRTWRFLNSFVATNASIELEGYPITESDAPPTKASQDRVIPFAVLSCTTCGNSHFLNLRILGLDELIIPESAKVPEIEE